MVSSGRDKAFDEADGDVAAARSRALRGRIAVVADDRRRVMNLPHEARHRTAPRWMRSVALNAAGWSDMQSRYR
jgi:hypothetical protein